MIFVVEYKNGKQTLRFAKLARDIESKDVYRIEPLNKITLYETVTYYFNHIINWLQRKRQ